MRKMSTTARIQGAREVVVQFLKSIGGREASQTEVYIHAAVHGFPNQNTIRGRLSELATEGVVDRRKGRHGTVWYNIPGAGGLDGEAAGLGK